MTDGDSGETSFLNSVTDGNKLRYVIVGGVSGALAEAFLDFIIGLITNFVYDILSPIPSLKSSLVVNLVLEANFLLFVSVFIFFTSLIITLYLLVFNSKSPTEYEANHEPEVSSDSTEVYEPEVSSDSTEVYEPEFPAGQSDSQVETLDPHSEPTGPEVDSSPASPGASLSKSPLNLLRAGLVTGALVGGLFGSLFFGPIVAVVAGIAGAVIGDRILFVF